MKINFTKEEIEDINNIISQYRDVSEELSEYQKKADEIQEIVIKLNSDLENIKSSEKQLMTELHNKYGDFNIYDIYDVLNYDR